MNQLTEREHEVLFWLANGKQPEEIATILQISRKRVNNVMYEARTKLNAKSTAHAIALCMARNYIKPLQIFDEDRLDATERWYSAVQRFMCVFLCICHIVAPGHDQARRVRRPNDLTVAEMQIEPELDTDLFLNLLRKKSSNRDLATA